MKRLKELYYKIAPVSKFQMDKINKELRNINESLLEENQKLNKIINKRFDEIEKQIKEIKSRVNVTEKQAYHSLLQAQESVWAHVWSDATKNVAWLNDITFSPGRWAVGYQYLYVLYRILNDVSPESILELGLGQSTRLISAYAGENKNVEHIVIEHDIEWIKFFSAKNILSSNTYIKKLELETGTFLDDDQVIMYNGFESFLKGRKFNLISIDAPFGGNAKKYARVDVVKILPFCLADSFVIMIDDYNRTGEKETEKIIEEKLQKADISYCKGIYSGVKQTVVITSEDWKFLCTL